jgi:hypothetical protein
MVFKSRGSTCVLPETDFTANGRFNRSDIDLPHRHHRIK